MQLREVAKAGRGRVFKCDAYDVVCLGAYVPHFVSIGCLVSEAQGRQRRPASLFDFVQNRPVVSRITQVLHQMFIAVWCLALGFMNEVFAEP